MFPLFNHRLRLWYRSWAGMVLLVEVRETSQTIRIILLYSLKDQTGSLLV